jgi:hypothetical protein
VGNSKNVSLRKVLLPEAEGNTAFSRTDIFTVTLKAMCVIYFITPIFLIKGHLLCEWKFTVINLLFASNSKKKFSRQPCFTAKIWLLPSNSKKFSCQPCFTAKIWLLPSNSKKRSVTWYHEGNSNNAFCWPMGNLHYKKN